MLRLLALLAMVCCVGAFIAPARVRLGLAQLGSKVKDQGNGGGEARGFGGGAAKKSKAAEPAQLVATEAAAAAAPAPQTASASAASPSAPATEADIDRIFKKYGINDDGAKGRAQAKVEAEKRAARGEEAPFGESVIAKLDAKTQLKFDKILITGVSLSLGFVILCGIGISAGALHVVFPDITIPKTFDDAITNVLTPAFTPALGVFFFFSISFGLFKFAQISSSQTVYREP